MVDPHFFQKLNTKDIEHVFIECNSHYQAVEIQNILLASSDKLKKMNQGRHDITMHKNIWIDMSDGEVAFYEELEEEDYTDGNTIVLKYFNLSFSMENLYKSFDILEDKYHD